MGSPQQHVLRDYPYPVAYPYSLVFDEADNPSQRLWALCFTQYQLLRTVCLPLVSQYLRAEVREDARESIAGLNRAIAAIRAPFFGDWLTLVHTLRRHLPKAGIQPLFPRLGEALEVLKGAEERPVGLRGNRRLDPLNAILALRNHVAHGGVPDQAEAAGYLESYLPVLNQVLSAFAFLADYRLKVCADERERIVTGRALVNSWRGVEVAAAAEEDLSDAEAASFGESAAVIAGPDGVTVPLYPLLTLLPVGDPLYLYDGHYGIRVEAKEVVERGYVCYLGTHHRRVDSLACRGLKDLLARRDISFLLEKEQTAPWTIAESASDYSRRTLEELVGTKYFPECYLPFADLEGHFHNFLQQPAPESWDWATDPACPRHVSGFLLIGATGAGKTAFLARQVEKLLTDERDQAERETRHLVLFLRGNGLLLRAEGMSLFRDVAEKLGVAVTGSAAQSRSRGGFSSFRELLDHLHHCWKHDRVPGRRLVLVLDALNEAPFAEKVAQEALEFIRVAACYPWCKVVCSIRQEWLGLWFRKLEPQELSPLEQARPWLYTTAPGVAGGLANPPGVAFEPFTEEQARQVYQRHQQATQDAGTATIRSRVPACRTEWDGLPSATRDLLVNPLYLHLFMEAFSGQPAEPVSTVPVLFQRYADRSLTERPGLWNCVEAVLDYLLLDLGRPSANLTDDDCHSIRQGWATGLSAEEARLRLNPIEGLAHEGIVGKRVREEGGGYRFVFQAVAEYLLYRHLAAARAAGEPELAYWTRRAAPVTVFPEYASAFTFLLREWAAQDRTAQIVSLVESSPAWLADVLGAHLTDQGRIGYLPGVGNPKFESLIRALGATAGRRCVRAMNHAGYQLGTGRFVLAALPCWVAAVSVEESLWQATPEDTKLGSGLGLSHSNLGYIYERVGRWSDAEHCYQRAVAVLEALWASDERTDEVGLWLASALSNLASLGLKTAQIPEALQASQRSVEIFERLCATASDTGQLLEGLANALINLGAALFRSRRLGEAEAAWRRSAGILESCLTKDPKGNQTRQNLGLVLGQLAVVFERNNQPEDAESAYRRSAEILTQARATDTDNVRLGVDLGRTLGNFTQFLLDAGRVREADLSLRQVIDLYADLVTTNPEEVALVEGLAGVLGAAARLGDAQSKGSVVPLGKLDCLQVARTLDRMAEAVPDRWRGAADMAVALDNLGVVLEHAGRRAEAEQMYTRAATLFEQLLATKQNPEQVLARWGDTLRHLGNAIADQGRGVEAEAVYRRAAEIHQTLWASNPQDCQHGELLGVSLYSLGWLLHEIGKFEDLVDVKRRLLEVYQSLSSAHPGNVEIGMRWAEHLRGVGVWIAERAIHRMAGLLMLSRVLAPEAEATFRQVADIYETLWLTRPQDTALGYRFLGALTNLFAWHRSAQQSDRAQRVARRTAEVYDSLGATGGELGKLGPALAEVFEYLGSRQKEHGDLLDVEATLRRLAGIFQALWSASSQDLELGDQLGRVWKHLAVLLNARGQGGDADAAWDAAVGVYQQMWSADPENLSVIGVYAEALFLAQRHAEAAPLVELFLKQVPDHPDMRRLKAAIAAKSSA